MKRLLAAVLFLALFVIAAVFFKPAMLVDMFKGGKQKQAPQQAKMVVADAPKLPEQISAYYRKANWDEAIRLAKMHLQVSPNDSTIRIIMAESYINKRDYSSAEREIKEVLEREPSNVWALRVLAWAYLSEKKNSEAQDVIDKALLVNPKDDGVNFTAAQVYSALGRLREALKYIESALVSQPNNNQFVAVKKRIEKKISQAK